MQLFQQQLGWEVANVYGGEVFGADGTIRRESEADVLLKGHVIDTLRRLNPNLPEQAYTQAYEQLNTSTSTKSMVEINQEKYQFLKEGIPVTYRNQLGEVVQNHRLKMIDFDDPERNHFLAVQQLWLTGKSGRRKRPDIVGFVNGIPLVFIELKAHHRKLRVAFEHNLTDYKDTIPRIFHFNAFILLSNGLDSKIGTITSKFTHFLDWKRIVEDQEGIVSLDTILRGTCDKGRCIDLTENYILFDDSIGTVVKLVARNHQFIGVNKAVAHIEQLRSDFEAGKINQEDKQKLGVFWHTQGSGKSYSMAFLTQKIHRKLSGSHTFLVVTDRKELDKQIYGTFAGVGAVKDKASRAKDGKDLKRLLKTDNRYIFTLIHKFNFEEVITDRDDIIVISDEAHRTQGGSLAMNLRRALPNASFMGFTGTPLFKDDQITRRIFGDYVSVYDFKRSIEDGATVPLYYENRGEKLSLDNPEINDQIRKAIEESDLDDDQEEKLKRLFSREYPVLTAEKRLRSIAKDVVWHFNNRGYLGKGMYVALDKVTAVKMYNFIKEEWEAYINQREKEITKIEDQQEQLVQYRRLEWTKETELAVVVSGEQNEIRKFKNWGLDIEPHREKMNNRDMEKEFKDEEHPFRLVIVCAMWITGFDVPSLSTLYLDKPMRTHTLMQTIARANRVHNSEKNNGLIVDYIETYKSLLEALAIYAIGGSKGGDHTGGGGEPPVRPMEELVEELRESSEAVTQFLKEEVEFEIDQVINSEGFERLKALQDGVDAVYRTDETKAKFSVLARDLFKKFKALMPDNRTYDFKPVRDAVNAIHAMIEEGIDESDISAIMKQVQDVVDENIESLNIAMEPTDDHGKKVDLSDLDFEMVEKHFLKIKNKNTVVQALKQKLERQLKRMVDENPLRIDFYEKYNEIIKEYNQGKEQVTLEETFNKLRKLQSELTEEETRSVRENLSEHELTIFDLLKKDKQLKPKERESVKAVAAELIMAMEDKLKVRLWFETPQASANVKQAIHDHLFQQLPYPTYDEIDITSKATVLFNFFKQQAEQAA